MIRFVRSVVAAYRRRSALAELRRAYQAEGTRYGFAMAEWCRAEMEGKSPLAAMRAEWRRIGGSGVEGPHFIGSTD